MRDYVHLHRKAIASWVFEDPRRWHLFSFLLMKADEKGRVEMSVNDYAKKFGTDRNWLFRCIKEMESLGIVETKSETKVRQKFTNLTICKYELYNTATAEQLDESETIVRQSVDFQEEKEGERERNVSPTPPSYKEKDKEREEAYCAKNLRSERKRDGQMTLFEDFKVDDNPAAQNGPVNTAAQNETDNPAAHDGAATPHAPSVPTFEEFWEAYAYKRDRRRAQAVWNRMKDEDRRAACEGIEAYKADCAACERQMVYPERYLKNERWKDDYSTSARPRSAYQDYFTQNPNTYYGSTQQCSDRERIQQLDAQRRFAGYAAVAAHFRAKGNQE